MNNILPKLQVLVGVAFALASWSASADTVMISQPNVTISRIGSHDGNVFYLSILEGFTVPCAYGVVYCPVGNAECRDRYALALSAKIAGKKLADFRYYHNTADNLCTLWLVSVD